jgi:uncharacterized damage-inducible protein DinB
MDYRDLFEYFKRQRAMLIEALEKLPNEEFTRNRGLSFGSIKDVLVHTVMAEDNWLHYRAAGIGNQTKVNLEDFNSISDVKRYIADVDAKTAEMFRKMTGRDLQRDVEMVYQDGMRKDTHKLEDILYHVPIEAIYHFGEIFAALWSMDLEAPYYGYRTYAMEKRTR